MGSMQTCIPCSETRKAPPLNSESQIEGKKFQLETTAQITIDASEMITSPARTSTNRKLRSKNIKAPIQLEPPKNYDINSLNAITIQKHFRGMKARKDFKDNLELLNNIVSLEPSSFKKEDIKQTIALNEGQQLFKKLMDNNQITEHVFEKKPLSKYLIETPLTFVDKTKNDDLYQGTMTLNKVKSGYGILYSNGCKYEGNWDHDKLNGYSRMFLRNGDYFEGNLNNGIAEGFGKFMHSDGNIYEGFWLNDKPHGNGKETYNDGSVFEGQFIDGEKVNGKLSWTDGSYYVGKIKNNLFHGEGMFHWAEGREYNGTWKEGKMNGNGVMTYSNGSVYEGEFKNGKRHGNGKYMWNEYKMYEGGWIDGKQNGYGVYKRNGKVTSGVWAGGKLLNENIPSSTTVSQSDTYNINFLQEKFADRNRNKNNINLSPSKSNMTEHFSVSSQKNLNS